MLIVTPEGTITGFCLANPKLTGEREQASEMLKRQPANRPHPGTMIVTDKGFAGGDLEDCLTSPQLGLTLIRPARKDESNPGASRTGCGSGSRRSSGPSRTSSAQNATGPASLPGCGPASFSASSPSTPRSGTT